MADELISRRAAIKLLRGECVAKYPCSFYVGLFAAADELSKLSSVDAVEVVRCKDCLYSTDSWTKVNEKGFLICPASGMEITDMDYCSYGERREENAE